MFFAAILFGVAQAILPVSDADLSRRLTTAAEELLRVEKKVTGVENGLDAVLYEDVLALLHAALHANPQNLHARVVSSDVLLLKAYDGDGTYDVCTLLEARGEAEFVTSHASRASDSDLAAARAVLRSIDSISPDAVPDPPSSCDEEDERQPGSRASASKTR
jgi:hypothetical protein